MDACIAVEREVEKVSGKFTSLQDHTHTTIDELSSSIESIRNELNEVSADKELSPAQSLILSQSIRRVKDAVSRMSTEHKDLHGSVSKVGKAVDRAFAGESGRGFIRNAWLVEMNFVTDFSSVIVDNAFEGDWKQRVLDEVICEHFLRQGMLDIAEALNEEATLNMDESSKEPFLELHRVLNALKQKNLRPALSWAEQNRGRLIEISSSIEFKLHRLQFIDLIRQGPARQIEALLYTRNFASFASLHAKELQVLMGSLLYLRQGIQTSPYAYLLDPIYWDEICDVFTRDACALMGMSVESPLSISIRAGCVALPPLLNIKQVMQQRQVSGVWSSKEELPVEIDLGEEYRYHSVFACPILRQQSNDINPPMRLICGHVISKDALNKLSNGTKVKCPYCPMEQAPIDAKIIHF